MDDDFYAEDPDLWGEHYIMPVCITHKRFLKCSGTKSSEPCVWSQEQRDFDMVREYHNEHSN